MKSSITTMALSFVAAGLVTGAASGARAQDNGFYIKGDVGGNLTQDIDLKEFFGPVAPGSKISLDPGIRAGINLGYQILPWISAEGEAGYFENQIRSISGATTIRDASFSNVPFLANLKLQLPNPTPLVPYIGAGVGFSEAIIDADRIAIDDTTLHHGSDADTVFAWQALAGLRYQFNPSLGLSVEYRYFVAGSARWTADFTSGTATDAMRFGRSQSHSVSLALELHF